MSTSDRTPGNSRLSARARQTEAKIAGKGRPTEEAALERDREEGQLHERHHDQQERSVLGRVGDDGLDLRLAGEEHDRREHPDDAEHDSGRQGPFDLTALEPPEHGARHPEQRTRDPARTRPSSPQMTTRAMSSGAYACVFVRCR